MADYRGGDFVWRFEMTKNLVNRIGLSDESWDAYLDEAAIEQGRAKIERVQFNEGWATKNHVDDLTIVKTFSGELLKDLMPLSYQERLSYLKALTKDQAVNVTL